MKMIKNKSKESAFRANLVFAAGVVLVIFLINGWFVVSEKADLACAQVIFENDSYAPTLGHSSGHFNLFKSLALPPVMTYDCYQDSIGPDGIDWRNKYPELAAQINYTKNYGSVQVK
jgi:hypothetical protein